MENSTMLMVPMINETFLWQFIADRLSWRKFPTKVSKFNVRVLALPNYDTSTSSMFMKQGMNLGNFPTSKHLIAPILSKWGDTNSTILKTLNLQKTMVDWMPRKVKPSSIFTKQIPFFQCYLSVTVATWQPFNGLKMIPICLFVQEFLNC